MSESRCTVMKQMDKLYTQKHSDSSRKLLNEKCFLENTQKKVTRGQRYLKIEQGMLLKKKSRKTEIPLVTCIRGSLSHAKNTNHLLNTNTVFVEASLRRGQFSRLLQGQND